MQRTDKKLKKKYLFFRLARSKAAASRRAGMVNPSIQQIVVGGLHTHTHMTDSQAADTVSAFQHKAKESGQMNTAQGS
ncbi:hypothetical protein XENTR_v10016252 [Xenopus tropicalis]|nr:hypothetical protein XENTR_v10016252 [Xenopus tropicalis]